MISVEQENVKCILKQYREFFNEIEYSLVNGDFYLPICARRGDTVNNNKISWSGNFADRHLIPNK